MYLDYFSLHRHPFRITPDPSLFFPGGEDGRGVILNALIYAITSGEGILKVVGEVGSGKTMLCRMLEEELPDSVEIVYIANPSLSAREILYAIAIELKLDVNSSTERLKVLHLIQDYLLGKHGKGGTVVVFIEEAQSMPIETLEEIRLLSNLETYQHKLMQIVLFGQPELDKILAQKNIRQLRERITHSFSLAPMSAKATSEYLQYRLKAAGCPRVQLISPRAEKLIAKASSGLTRRINILADKALLAAYADSPSRQPTQEGNDPLVLPRHVRAAIRDSDYGNHFYNPWVFGGLGLVAAGVLAGVLVSTDLIPLGLLNDNSSQVSLNTVVESRTVESRTVESGTVESGTEPNTASTPETPNNIPVASNEETVADEIAPDLPVQVALEGNITRAPQEELSTAAALIADAVETVQPQYEEQEIDQPEPVAEVEVALLEEALVDEVDIEDAQEPDNEELGAELETQATEAVLNSAPIQEDEPAANLDIVTAGSAENIVDLVSSDEEDEEISAPMLTPPVVVLPSGLTELRMNPTAEWLRSLEGKSGYTIQLFSVPSTNPSGLEEYLQFLQLVSLLNDTYICFMPISSDNSGRWQVMHKEFEGVTPARSLINDLPVYIQQYGPYVRNLNGVECSYPYQVGR